MFASRQTIALETIRHELIANWLSMLVIDNRLQLCRIDSNEPCFPLGDQADGCWTLYHHHVELRRELCSHCISQQFHLLLTVNGSSIIIIRGGLIVERAPHPDKFSFFFGEDLRSHPLVDGTVLESTLQAWDPNLDGTDLLESGTGGQHGTHGTLFHGGPVLPRLPGPRLNLHLS